MHSPVFGKERLHDGEGLFELAEVAHCFADAPLGYAGILVLTLVAVGKSAPAQRDQGGCVVFRLKVRPVDIVIERAEPITGFVVGETFCDIAQKKKKVIPRQANISLSASVFLSILARVG